MKPVINILLLLVCFLFIGKNVIAADPATPELKCPPGVEQLPASSGICADPGSGIAPGVPEGSLPLLLPPQVSGTTGGETLQVPETARTEDSATKTIVYFFRGEGCPHCEEEKYFLDGLKPANPALEVREYEVWHDSDNASLMAAMLRAHGVRSSGVPVTFIHDQMFQGFTPRTKLLIENKVRECRAVSCGDPAEVQAKTVQKGPAAKARPFRAVSTASTATTATTTATGEAETSFTVPLLGVFDTRNTSLPVLTLVIGGMDSFNPCAFFVLLSLLSLLVHAQSRHKMLLIGGIFVFFSGFIYFLFMAAWLNLFLVMGHVAAITTVAGGVSVIIAGINIKDFFLFKQGVSLSIPDSAKPKLFDRMRKLLRSTSLASILLGATVLAVLANFYELLCTAGFPMVFTRILTLNNLSTATYYLYLVLYNIVYVIPLLIIVLGFTFTLGKRQLSEWQGRVLKLVSGAMMLGLGAVLLVNPALLNSVGVSLVILLAALGFSLLVATLTRKLGG